MFFKIINLSVDSKNKQIVLGNILDACREGRHFIWIPKNEIKHLTQQEGAFDFLSLAQKDTLDKLYHNIGDDGAQYLSTLSIFIEIHFDDSTQPILDTKKIVKSYRDFLNSESLREITLLVENLDDGKFYHELALVYQERNYPKHDRIKLVNKPMLGGGSTTYTVFKQECSYAQPLLCILDSDKTHPNQTTYGETAKKVLSEKEKVVNKIVDVHILHVRAIENLMPMNILKAISTPNKIFGLVFNLDNQEYLKYIKCKGQHTSKKYQSEYQKFRDKGYISLEEINEIYSKDSKYGYFWSKFYEKHKDSKNDVVCANMHDNLILGGGFLANCLDVAQNNPAIRNDLIADRTACWNDIASKIFSWSFSSHV